MRVVHRPPFDPADAMQAEAYMHRHKLAIVDPFAEPDATQDLLFKLSLSGIRFVMAQSFAAARADGARFRAYSMVVGRPTANAFAVEASGLHLCGLDIGLGSAAFEIVLFTFGQASLFRDIGQADGERAPDLPDGA